jgi:predicted ATPase/DNA-binding SARP family transcriptional activator
LIRTTMRFLVLGPLEVISGDGASIPLGGRKQRRLLAMLLLHANHVVDRDQLIESAWSDGPPPSAQESLDAYVYRLRRLLGRDRIARRDGGYLLLVGPGELDADDFEQLLAQASGAAEAREHRAAIAGFEQALGLCRGAAWAELDGDLAAIGDALRVDELKISATEALLEGRLALGAGAELVPELEQLHRESPLRERPVAALMLALYRAGRQTDALASYRELCRVLREQLGLQPSESLRQLERAILRHDSSLLAMPAGAPTHAAGHLPVPATPFLGRGRELGEVTALVWGAGGRLVTLTGAGGSGKTRLALRAAQVCAADYRGGAWFVGFADLTDPGLIAPVICQALGIGEQPDLAPAQRLQEYLGDRELLLVLDNLEQLTAGVGVLAELLAGCPGVRILATSREPLRLAAEQRYEVSVLDPEDATELFIARAKAVAPSLTIEREPAVAVCERLDRLPLAIELAAARTTVLSPAEMLDRLERHLPVLASGPRDAPRRQHTLQATIDWSYGLLTEEEQGLLVRLSVFAGGCTLRAAEAVCDAELDALEALVDRSLVRVDRGRYRMLQTLREYALEKLARSGEEDHVRRRHAQCLIELLHTHRLDECLPDVGPRTVRGLVEQDERENFRAALEWAKQAGEIETVARLAAPLAPLWIWGGRLSEADRWLGVARERSTEYPLPLQGLLLTAARELACARGAHQESADLCDRALAVYRELGDAAGMLLETTKRAAAEGDLRRSRALLEEALTIEREHNLRHAHAHTLVHLACSYVAEGRLDRARALLEEALLATEAGSGARVLVQVNLAYIANVERRHTDAAELAQEVLERAFAIGHSHTAAVAALELAWSFAELHRPERAARILGAALEFYRDAGTFMQSDEAESEQAIRDAVRAHLDERTFHALLDEGRGMTVEQAVREEYQQTAQRA